MRTNHSANGIHLHLTKSLGNIVNWRYSDTTINCHTYRHWDALKVQTLQIFY